MAGRKIAALAGVVLWASMAGDGAAVMICKCCGDGVVEQCKAACQQAMGPSGLCRPTVAFGQEAAKSQGDGLGEVNLKYLWLAKASKPQLEKFRVYLENRRRAAERRFATANWRYRHKRISAEDFRKAEARRDKILVNYYHAMRAYIAALRAQ